jgi:Competence protein J (ComJ)
LRWPGESPAISVFECQNPPVRQDGQVRLIISHSQIAVFDPSLERPFNSWTDAHVAQGFSWRPGSVSFSTLCEWGRYDVEVIVDGDGAPWPMQELVRLKFLAR